MLSRALTRMLPTGRYASNSARPALGKAAQLTSAREVMKMSRFKKMHAVSETSKVKDVCDILAKENIGALPVTTKAGDVVGVVSERDVIRICSTKAGDGMTTSVADIMVPKEKIVTCSVDDSVYVVMEKMLENG